MLLTGCKIDDESAVIVPRILVVHPLFHVDVDAAHRIYNPLECRRIDHDVVRDGNPHKFANRGKCHLMPTECIRMVDLVIAVAANLDARITRDRQQHGPPVFFIDCSKHERVTAPDIALSAVDTHEEHIAHIVFRQIGKRVHIPQRSGHDVAAKVVNGADKQKGNRKDGCCIFNKRAIVLI